MQTTAQQLIAYRNELRDGGIHSDRADDLVRDAAARIVQANGLIVSLPTDPPTDSR